MVVQRVCWVGKGRRERREGGRGLLWRQERMGGDCVLLAKGSTGTTRCIHTILKSKAV